MNNGKILKYVPKQKSGKRIFWKDDTKKTQKKWLLRCDVCVWFI